jgi:pimeloyl-ACP methyl ester carboxylesterase
MSEPITAADGELWVESRGEGPDVLLIAGLGDPLETWEAQFQGLADRYRLVAFDNRGSGRSPLTEEPLTVASMADDAAQVLDARGVGSAHVVGHSGGSVVAQELALRRPDLVRSLTLVGTGDPLTNLVFDRNVIDTVAGSHSHGLMIGGGSVNNALTIESNLFRDIGSIGMLFEGAVNVGLNANTFVRAGTANTVEWKGGATGTIDSNVLYQAASSGPQPWYQDPSSNPSHAYNLAWGGKLLSDEATGLNADPDFYDPDGKRGRDRLDDFSLSAGSPAVDRGVGTCWLLL